MDIVQYKKKVLSCKQFIRQQAKGTLDSPCMSVCSRDENDMCLACGLFPDEKKGWSSLTPFKKEQVRRACSDRLITLREEAVDKVEFCAL